MKEAELLNLKIDSLLNNESYSEALEILDEQKTKFLNSPQKNFYLLTEIAGCFITVGSESYDEETIRKGLSLFEQYREELKKYITEDSFDYCVGNAFQGLYEIEAKNTSNFFPSLSIVRDKLFNAKQLYFKCFKKIEIKHLKNFDIEILTNLGNNLYCSGRIVESLQLYDTVLQHNQDFPYATLAKANRLFYMQKLTKSQITLSLVAEIYSLYKKVQGKNLLNEDRRNEVQIKMEVCYKYLVSQKFDFNSLPREIKLNEIEYLSHSPKVRFYLDNFLSLSEHGLYCKCNGAKYDDLIIGYFGSITKSDKVVHLEQLLNRVKSEFSLAREMFYEYKTQELEDNLHYETFGKSGTLYGTKAEKLRTSFRICFGILDKIAEGICYLFEIQKGKNENVYFESFWKKERNLQKLCQRWEKLNSIKNIHLTALYSIACDLNQKNGEFGFYKEWRNQLEHGVFSLTTTQEELDLISGSLFGECVLESDFAIKAKHLLQLTRAAIFSYTFCVRQEMSGEIENNGRP